jgi:hypothetical protein
MNIKKIRPDIKRRLKKLAEDERVRKLSEPHTWFAWYPIRIDENTLVWFEHVTRWADTQFVYNDVWDEGWKVIRWNYSKINSK